MEPETRRYTYAFDESAAVPADELPRLLGGKGANLAVMAGRLGLPVPAGFTISTHACREFLAGRWPDGLDDELRAQMASLGEGIGRRFGDPADPLLVSVRSGAPVSMPGMMDTILDLGLTRATVDGLARAVGDERFAADCLRRLQKGYREVIGREDVPEDPWLQLRAAIEAVFGSWHSDRARAYRRREGIPDDLGTAVTVQAMVFGNRGADSGTGVVFTRNPSTGEPILYGDILFDAQGEDVVAGSHATQPLSVLDERLPAVATELRRVADLLEHHYADLCDIEFTIERGRLWLLQVRVGKRSARAALRMAIDMAREDGFPLSREDAVRRVAPGLADPPRIFVRAIDAPAPIATGLPASPGVASGGVVTTSDAAEAAAAEGRSVILVRAETSPEDVRGMARAAGVLTARGGLASHAAVVARGWGIPAVVGAEAVRPGDDRVEIDGHSLAIGAEITIDGSTGEVFMGSLTGQWEVAPEAATLRAWADEIGVDLGEGQAEQVTAGAGGSPGGEAPGDLGVDDVTRALAIRGTVTPEQAAEGLMADPAQVAPLVEELVRDGLVEVTGDGFRLSGKGKLKAVALFDADRASFGSERGGALLEAFHALDNRVKRIVTAWQLRDVGGEQTFNDHGDEAYDAGVLEELATVHAELVEWLGPLAATLRRFGAYRARLAHALETARGGDQRYVASPRVDSYHSVWFELHEDLIRLTGRSRSDEEAAGRA